MNHSGSLPNAPATLVEAGMDRFKAALLGANFMLSREGQQFLTRKGRLPTRSDVETNPPGIIDLLRQKRIIVTNSSAEEQKKMQTTFNEIFRPR